VRKAARLFTQIAAVMVGVVLGTAGTLAVVGAF
jgi:hypothetical protein